MKHHPYLFHKYHLWFNLNSHGLLKKNAYKGETYEAQSSYAHVGVIEKTSRLGRAIGEDMMKKPMRLGDDLERNYEHYHHVAPQ